MSDKAELPGGSSFDLAGSVQGVVNDATNYVTDVYNSLTGQPTPAPNTTAPVPPTGAEQTTATEAMRASNPLDNIKLTSSESTAINNFRDERHKAFLNENKFAVRLKSLSNQDTVAFRVTPEIGETRSAAYKTIDPIHMPGAVQVYTNSAPRTWNISGIKLVSRNGVEAEENLATINQLRSWMMPFFGETNTAGKDNYGPDLLGAPPEVLTFTAYSDEKREKGVTNIRNIPVVMTTLNIPYPTDVDYIKTDKTGQPFPAVMMVDIILVETHSPKELSEFDLIDYRHGMLPGF